MHSYLLPVSRSSHPYHLAWSAILFQTDNRAPCHCLKLNYGGRHSVTRVPGGNSRSTDLSQDCSTVLCGKLSFIFRKIPLPLSLIICYLRIFFAAIIIEFIVLQFMTHKVTSPEFYS